MNASVKPAGGAGGLEGIVAGQTSVCTLEGRMLYEEKEKGLTTLEIKTLIDEGKKVLASDEKCAGCHKFGDAGSLGTAPDLTGYGSEEWLRELIANPAHERFYADQNDRMPAFAKDRANPKNNQLSPKELDMLVKWLRGDWYKPSRGGEQ